MEGFLISKLKEKIDILISKYEEERVANAKLQDENQKLSEQLYNTNTRIKELEQQINNIQLREAFKGSSQDVAQARKKITFLIKEIDNCIDLIEKENDS